MSVKAFCYKKPDFTFIYDLYDVMYVWDEQKAVFGLCDGKFELNSLGTRKPSNCKICVIILKKPYSS
jgi:hypothetical protein